MVIAMHMGRRNVLLSGAAAAVGVPSLAIHSGLGDKSPVGTSGQAAVLDRRASFSLSYYNSWVYDIQTHRGSAQAFLVSSSPGDQVLTAAAMSTVTAAVQRALSELAAVKSSQVTPIDAHLTPPWNADGYPSLVFDSKWNVTGYNISVGNSGTSQAWFARQATDVSAAVQSAFAALPGVTACTEVAQPTVTPSSVRALNQ